MKRLFSLFLTLCCLSSAVLATPPDSLQQPRYLSAPFRCSAQGHEASGLLRMATDSLIWINASKVIELGRAVATPDSVFAYVKINNTYFRGNYQDLKQATGVNTTFAQLQRRIQNSLQSNDKKLSANIHTSQYNLQGTAQFSRVDTLASCSFPFSIPKNAKPLYTPAPQIDSAAWIIDRYLAKLNYGPLKPDSMLYIESVIVNQGDPTDTVFLRRWFAHPEYSRVEIWRNNKLIEGLYANGTDEYRRYDTIRHAWGSKTRADYFDFIEAYDYRGPLYHWRTNGSEITYQGEVDFQGQKVYNVFVAAPFHYDRFYLFEKESGLLFMFTEADHVWGDERINPNLHVDWRAYNEYMPVSGMLLPYVESYQKDQSITLVRHYMWYEPLDLKLFNREGK